MVSRNKSDSSMREKFQMLRSITNSHAESETSIIADASKYIKKLKKKVEEINNVATSEQYFCDPTDPMVTVETLENGFLINITSRKNDGGMLVCLLEAFEDLGLDVVEARVSCTNSFSMHAVGSSNYDDGESMDAEAVKQAVEVAVTTWSDGHDPKW
ncbi:hypothetical protein Bca4012_040149 [Brassica carinata]|uniref:Plant bHLH transcription factor ACT-like domain-containing protein n=1 Tax=Brassica carinata TaxID=52824 RepID=A0A8X7W956_BRACI|nr:hypothetical protein Bca52824_008379 [Brassica carinata]